MSIVDSLTPNDLDLLDPMKTLFQRSGVYLGTKDTLSWFLVSVGIVIIAMLAESIKLHEELGPNGGHHGDVAGGFSMLVFLFAVSLVILAFSGVAAVLAKSSVPLTGAVFGLVASIPMLVVLSVSSALLGRVSPLLATPVTFAVGIALVVMGFFRKTKKAMGE